MSSEEKLRQQRAHGQLSKAVKSGKLIKPDKCEECGIGGKQWRIQGCHFDYNEPLKVRWLCGTCHKKWDLHGTHPAKIASAIDREFFMERQFMVSLPHRVHAQIKGHAKQMKISMAEVIRRALAKYFQEV